MAKVWIALATAGCSTATAAIGDLGNQHLLAAAACVLAMGLAFEVARVSCRLELATVSCAARARHNGAPIAGRAKPRWVMRRPSPSRYRLNPRRTLAADDPLS